MDELSSRQKKALVIGGAIGALIGASVTWLMILAPSDGADDEEPVEISAGDVLSLMGAVSATVKMIDSFRRRL